MSSAYIVDGLAMTSLNGNNESSVRLIKSQKCFVKDILKNSVTGEDYPIPYAGYFEDLPFNKCYEPETSRTLVVLDRMINTFFRKMECRNLKIDQVIGFLKPFWLDDVESFLRFDSAPMNINFQYEFSPENVIYNSLKRNGVIVDKLDIQIIDNTCTSGNSVLGIAAQGIKLNLWKNCLVIAIDLMDLHIAVNLKALGALSLNQSDAAKASRPFDKKRDGFVKSDGAAIALVSNSKVNTNDPEILGFSQTSDAYKLTEGAENGDSIAKAIQIALDQANIRADQISFVKAHGTSTRLNDLHEAQAINNLFYKNQIKVPVTSLKGHLGHTNDASGLVETILAAELLKEGLIPFTLNCDDPEYDIDIVRSLRVESDKRFFISNTSGFGGNNSSLILKVGQ